MPPGNQPASISVTCACGGKFQAPPALAGKRVKCPKCGQPIAVPPPAAPQSSAPSDDDPLGLGPMGLDLGTPLSPGQSAPGYAAPGSPPRPYGTPAANPRPVPMSYQPYPAANQYAANQYGAPRPPRNSGRWLIISGVVGGLVVIMGLVGICCVFPFLRGFQAAQQRAAGAASGEWVSYVSEDGRFTVLVPKGYLVSDGPTRVDDVTLAGNSVRAVSPQGAIFQVVSLHVPELETDAQHQDFLDKALDMLGQKVQFQQRRQITLSGHPGREIAFRTQVSGEEVLLTSRRYSAKGRAYFVNVYTFPGESPTEDMNKFFDSFTIR